MSEFKLDAEHESKTHRLGKSCYFIVFHEEGDGTMSVRKFWSYDIMYTKKMSKVEARKLWRESLADGYVHNPRVVCF